MTQTAHTPGPWEVGKDSGDKHSIYGMAGRLAIAQQGEANVNHANARLIGAAPEMLAALHAWVVFDTNIEASGIQLMLNYNDALALTTAAITKATGGEA